VKKKSSKAKEFKTAKEMDKYLEDTDLGDFFLDAEMTHPKIKKINLDLPEWLIEHLDLEAARAGVSRQPLIKLWLIQKLEEERHKRTIG
jgi:predicted DNA binding CopG/RHH family protein